MANYGPEWDPEVARIVVELTAARKMQHMTVKDLAAKTGLAHRSLYSWEHDDCQPHMDRLRRWAEGLGYTLKIDIK